MSLPLRLISFKSAKNSLNRLGVLSNNGTAVIDLSHSYFTHHNEFKVISTMRDMIKGGLPLLEFTKSLLAKEVPESAKLRSDEIILNAPIEPLRNLMCIGKNYVDHVAEIKNVDIKADKSQPIELPKYPVFFTKSTTSVVAPNDFIESHTGLTKWLDYEAELAVIIGKQGRDILPEDVEDYIYGYTIANDVTARDLQRHHMQWFKGKTLDRTCPIGPCIVPASDIDISDLAIKLWLNGELKQNSRTSKMIFKIPEIISTLSQGFTLLPGDIILTGTPDGVGYAAKPPRTMVPGDKVKIEIEGIGTLENSVQ